jgi:3-oxoacyl-[acyl-carrier protein] reductase
MPDATIKPAQNVMVTGASRGLGLAIARHLAAGGYTVIGIARKSSDELAAAQDEAKAAGRGAIHLVPFDLAETGKLQGLVADTRKQFGPLYALVNNAAIGTDGALGVMHDSQIATLINLNVTSPITLTKYAVRHMMADGAGRVINISSIIGFTGYSGLSVYGATKSAMLGFTRSLAREVGRMGITVNAVAPGFMATEMTKALGDSEQERIANRSALKRLPVPDDVAHTVAFLLGEGGKNITGATLTVDAGATA